jgi:hypothetical protein
MFLLSVDVGLRAKEVAQLTWSMVTDANGQLCDKISLENSVAKGNGGRSRLYEQATAGSIL